MCSLCAFNSLGLWLLAPLALATTALRRSSPDRGGRSCGRRRATNARYPPAFAPLASAATELHGEDRARRVKPPHIASRCFAFAFHDATMRGDDEGMVAAGARPRRGSSGQRPAHLQLPPHPPLPVPHTRRPQNAAMFPYLLTPLHTCPPAFASRVICGANTFRRMPTVARCASPSGSTGGVQACHRPSRDCSCSRPCRAPRKECA
mmetsp:Transcript_16513/g.53852  ORF Transcript_16513/g.53852 Transcript_16513/m.53852 type:complete len:206 (-) Transcript_16513:2028-2645(-)